jgi:peptide/nickel transport system ATP-binding protein
VQANILTLLQDLRRDHRVAMLFISHDLAVVRNLADWVGVLFRGHLMQIGPARKTFSPPFHPYTHELLMAAPGPQAARRHATPRLAQAKPTAAIEKGCLFAGRCPWQVGSLCDEVTPPWRSTDSGTRIRCHIELAELSRHATECAPRSESRVNDSAPSVTSSVQGAPDVGRSNVPSRE